MIAVITASAQGHTIRRACSPVGPRPASASSSLAAAAAPARFRSEPAGPRGSRHHRAARPRPRRHRRGRDGVVVLASTPHRFPRAHWPAIRRAPAAIFRLVSVLAPFAGRRNAKKSVSLLAAVGPGTSRRQSRARRGADEAPQPSRGYAPHEHRSEHTPERYIR